MAHSTKTTSGPNGRQASDFRERLYRSYVTTHTGVPPAERIQRSLAHVIRQLPPDRQAPILDLGCGQGCLVRLLGEIGYQNVLGLDTSVEQVAEAHRQGIDNVHHADVFDYLGDNRARFDVVVAVDVLEHFEKPDVLVLLDSIHSALRPGGSLVAQVPNGGSPFAGRYVFGDFTHATAFTSRSLSQLLSATGFDEPAVFPVEPIVHGLTSFVRFFLWRSIALALKAALAAETGVVRGHIVTQNLVFRAFRPA